MHALHCSGIAALSDGSSLSPEETLTSQRQRRHNAYVSPLLGAISAGHSITQSGLKWALYDFFFFLAFEFPAHGEHFVETPSLFFAHYTNRDYNWKMRNDGRKTKKKKKKSRCSNDGDFGLRGRRFWRDENDGDSVPMTESWQVWTLYGQGSQKLYNWPKILSPPHYRNGVHHTVESIGLYCG